MLKSWCQCWQMTRNRRGWHAHTQALERNARGGRMQHYGGRKANGFYRIIRPASGVHSSDMNSEGAAACSLDCQLCPGASAHRAAGTFTERQWCRLTGPIMFRCMQTFSRSTRGSTPSGRSRSGWSAPGARSTRRTPASEPLLAVGQEMFPLTGLVACHCKIMGKLFRGVMRLLLQEVRSESFAAQIMQAALCGAAPHHRRPVARAACSPEGAEGGCQVSFKVCYPKDTIFHIKME